MALRRNLTDRFIKSVKPAPIGKRAIHWDVIVPNMAVRVTERGHKSFVLVTRYPGSRNPTARALGDYGPLTLEAARTKARGWLELIGKGIDPEIEEARQRALEQRKLANTFATVAEQFLARHGATLAKSAEARRIVEAEFVARWGKRPATEILPEEVASAIRAIVDRGAPYQAHNALGYIRRLFNWAIGTHEFGITASPVDRLRPRDLIGRRESRDRILNDDELREVWDAAKELGYPYGPFVRLLILTGQRESEVAGLRRNEVETLKRLWIVPAERMKGKRPHEVPLAPLAFALVEEQPRFNGGDFVFTTTSGMKSINGFSKMKSRIDGLIAKARLKRGEDLMTPWVLHDLRRTVRTHLSALPVEDIVRELVIAHAKKGLHKVYDQHSYRDEKRKCLELWETRLHGVLQPTRAMAA